MNDQMPPFEGFGDRAISFWSELKANNNRDFFNAHRDVYDDHIREPLERLLDEVAAEFGANGKVYRPNRDVRFSKDKSPYKLSGAAAVGDDSETSSVYYVQISAEGLFVASGIYLMTRDQLRRFYTAVDDDASGRRLTTLVQQGRADGLDVGGSALKTAPRGYATDHPRVELLRHKSVTVARAFAPHHEWIFTRAALSRVTDLWRDAAPINDWLTAHVGHPEN